MSLSALYDYHTVLAMGIAVLCLAYMLSSTCRFYVRLVTYHAVIFMCAAYLILLACIKPGNINNYFLAKYCGVPLFWLVSPILQVGVRVRGLEHLYKCSSPYIIACNHQSSLDLYPLFRILPPRTVTLAKKALLYVPVFGQAAWLIQTVFIDRKDHDTTMQTFNKVIDDMKKKKFNLWVFPEGTRNFKHDGLLPFKKGAFHLAVKAQIPIIPIVIAPYSDFYIYNEKKLDRELRITYRYCNKGTVPK
ncbi:1-acyl-sn-glycerol-3-phosphate acyltransferase alpha [Trichoplax sp. H2]|nr:1-acyl-sn-glycerol-3-phosphate acyltransferase alpha [Trichoplax sp. H2]|eukprot:RDD43402.1 1-acyl-sn-glycerol-3-phosphate acyltransferase alpha [Trichoplax sp. H2]